MKNTLYITILLCSLQGITQEFADKNYYLIDSLVIEELDNSDEKLVDSCLNEFHKAIHDTSKINAINHIVDESLDENLWEKYNMWVYQFSQKKLKKANNTVIIKHLKTSLAGGINNIGFLYEKQGYYIKALEYYHRGLAIQREIGDKSGIAINLNNIGIIFADQGDIPNALDYYHKSLVIQEEIGNKKGVANSLTNIGIIYKTQGNISKALDYYDKGLSIYEEIGAKGGMAMSLNNFGNIYQDQGEVQKALDYFYKSLAIYKEIDNKMGIAYILNNIGNIYQTQDNTPKALDYYQKSLVIQEEIDNKKGIAYSFNSIGVLQLNRGSLQEAKENGLKSLSLAQELGFPIEIKNAASLLSDVYQKQGNAMMALEMYKLFVTMNDSLNNEATQKAAAQQSAKYIYEKQKALDDSANNKRIAIEQEEKRKQKLLTISIAFGFVVLMMFFLFVYNRLRVTKKQKNEISEQKEIIERAHKKITDSINYAKRLQDAILPSFTEIDQHFSNNFVHFQPKDVVSGDFYWYEKIHDSYYLAVADCTGHGVSGAILSVICSNALKRSIKEFEISDPAKILDKTRELVIEFFNTSGGEVKDGMDIALCAFKGEKVIYSGANTPLWIVRKTNLLTHEQKEAKYTITQDDLSLINYAANKQPIGLFPLMKDFVQEEIELYPGDSLYFFTDGYADQFGGKKGKKFKYKPLKHFLIDINDYPMKKQQQLMTNTFDNWKGDLGQVDDVCIIGVKIE